MIPRASAVLINLARGITAPPLWRAFSSTPALLAKPLPPRKVIKDEDIEENYLKGSGPGGQKINKTNSAVQLKHLPTGVVVKCQETRSRTQNRKLARRLLSDRLEEMELGDQARTVLKKQAAAKKKASKAKKARRKYRKLEEEKASATRGGPDDDEEDEEDDTVEETPASDVAGICVEKHEGSKFDVSASHDERLHNKTAY